MEKITTVGLDLAKQVIAVHAVGTDGGSPTFDREAKLLTIGYL